MMKPKVEKILFLTHNPFDEKVHITSEVLECIPIQKVLSVREYADEIETVAEDVLDDISHYVITAGEELHREKGVSAAELRGVMNDIDISSASDYDDPEDWIYSYSCAFQEYYKHIYIVEALIEE